MAGSLRCALSSRYTSSMPKDVKKQPIQKRTTYETLKRLDIEFLKHCITCCCVKHSARYFAPYTKIHFQYVLLIGCSIDRCVVPRLQLLKEFGAPIAQYTTVLLTYRSSNHCFEVRNSLPVGRLQRKEKVGQILDGIVLSCSGVGNTLISEKYFMMLGRLLRIATARQLAILPLMLYVPEDKNLPE